MLKHIHGVDWRNVSCNWYKSTLTMEVSIEFISSHSFDMSTLGWDSYSSNRPSFGRIGLELIFFLTCFFFQQLIKDVWKKISTAPRHDSWCCALFSWIHLLYTILLHANDLCQWPLPSPTRWCDFNNVVYVCGYVDRRRVDSDSLKFYWLF